MINASPSSRIALKMRALRSRLADPGRVALKSAARAAIVMPAVFAFADKVIQRPDLTIFAAFGSFAILVLADFGGPPRTRLLAYLGLFVAGAVFITLGTLCSRDPWLGAAAMAVVAFGVLFSAVMGGYFAAGGFAALLTFILPVNLPGDPSAIPPRLEGWALACGVGISAVMLLWPPRPRDELRDAAARACRSLADLVAAELDGDRSLISDRAGAARTDVAAVGREFVSTPYRPTGPTGSTAALAVLVDELDWFLSVVLPQADGPGAASGSSGEENREVLAAVGSALRASAATLDQGAERPDLVRLDRAREGVAEAVVRDVAQRPLARDDLALLSAMEPSFRMREMSLAAREIGRNALRAAGVGTSQPGAPRRRSELQATRRLAGEHASARSVVFRNSVRGSAALAIAVLIAQQASFQHAFWVVLGTLAVLRSSALGTGASVLSALAGTALGLLLGVGIVIAAGTDEGVLWALLPVAVLLAAYAPRVISFAAGQAGFTLTLLILFNLIQPTGWTVGLVRVEDVAVGFAVSLGVGALFWPRGAAALVRHSLATSYARGADYVAATAQRLVGGGNASRVGGAERDATAAADRLDDAFRQYLAERSVDHVTLEDLTTLLAGTTRLRLAAYSLSTLDRPPDGPAGQESGLGTLDREVRQLRSWYQALGDALVDAGPAQPPHHRDLEGRLMVARRVHEAVARGDMPGIRRALGLLWASQQLDNLRRLESHLIGPAGDLAHRAA
jgi:uncharacterized membrane protein YccC